MAGRHRRDLRERAFALATDVYSLFPKLAAAGAAHAYVARQLLAAATSIGANLEEGHAATTRREMRFKHRISLREAREANYWARLASTDPAWRRRLEHIVRETAEFIAMLTASVRKLGEPEPEAPSTLLRVRPRPRRTGRVARRVANRRRSRRRPTGRFP